MSSYTLKLQKEAAQLQSHKLPGREPMHGKNHIYESIEDLYNHFKSKTPLQRKLDIFDAQLTVLDDHVVGHDEDIKQLHFFVNLEVPKSEIKQVTTCLQSLPSMEYYKRVFQLTVWHNSVIPQEQLDLLQTGNKVWITNLRNASLLNENGPQASTSTHTTITLMK